MKEFVMLVISGTMMAIAADLALKYGARLCGICYAMAVNKTNEELAKSE